MTRGGTSPRVAVASTVTLGLIGLVGLQFVLLGVAIEMRDAIQGSAAAALVVLSGLCFAASLALARALG